MIYGYTLDAPWFGGNALLVCKNAFYSDHERIWQELWESGGNYLVKKDFGHRGREYIDPTEHESTLQNYFIQYGGNCYTIDKIINVFNIQMLARFNQHSLKQDELSVIEQINLAVKLEADPYCHSEGK